MTSTDRFVFREGIPDDYDDDDDDDRGRAAMTAACTTEGNAFDEHRR